MPKRFLPKPFRCSVARDGQIVRLRPAGELDMSTVPVLDEQMRAALEEGARMIVVDLRDLTFMDSTGLTLLIRWSLFAQRDGYDIALVRGPERVHQLFTLTGMTPHFRFIDE